MVAMAVLGHEAPATSWSDIDEERKKALFSLFAKECPLLSKTTYDAEKPFPAPTSKHL